MIYNVVVTPYCEVYISPDTTKRYIEAFHKKRAPVKSRKEAIDQLTKYAMLRAQHDWVTGTDGPIVI